MNLADLKAPFPAVDIEWRIQSSGMKGDKPWGLVLAYVTNRAIMDRLDDVCGPDNWSNKYDKGPDGGILCCISVKTGDDWVPKWDGAENTAVESIKGGLSSAMKRAAVQWGIGRYLYNLSTDWANFCDKGANRAKIKSPSGDKWFKWDPPNLPAWALPDGAGQAKKEKATTTSPIGLPKPISAQQRTVLNTKMKLIKLDESQRKDFYNSVLSLSSKKIATTAWAADFIENFDNYLELWTASKEIH